jgi:hypothetical protein
MYNINLQKFGKAQAIVILISRIFRRYTVVQVDIYSEARATGSAILSSDSLRVTII